jgi:hypothetical protein
MKTSEKMKRAFVRPKVMFKRKELKLTKKGKVFGLTLANGKQLLCHCPTPFSSKAFAKIVRQRVGPFVKKAYPTRRRCTILLDGEPLIHAPESKAAMKEWGMAALPRWPAYSPDLNPQENVWPWIEKELRKREHKSDTFATFKRKLLHTASTYPNASALIPSMQRRVAMCIRKEGEMIKT